MSGRPFIHPERFDMRTSSLILAASLLAVQVQSATAADDPPPTTPTATTTSTGPLTFGGGVSTQLLFIPNFVVAHLGCDLGSAASVNAYFGAGPNLDHLSVWMMRPGVQLRLYPGGDNRGGLFLGPEARLWTGSGDTRRELGGRIGGRLPTSAGFDVDVSLAAFYTFDDRKNRAPDAQDGLVVAAAVTTDVWLVWRF